MKPRKGRITRIDYCQYLLVSQINYTLTNYAEHTDKFSHDMANRYLAGDEVRPRLVWENVNTQVVQTPYGFLVFDDTVADKNFSRKIEKFGKIYYCPLKDNRQVDDSGGEKPYQRVDNLTWNETENKKGKIIKIKGFPAQHKVKVFRVVLSTQRTDYVVTNEMEQDNVDVVHTVCGFRWKVEQFHRETKQLTGIEGSQCRKARLVRNHIGCAILVWVRLKQVAVETGRTIYRVKHDLLDHYLSQQLKSPIIQMRLA